MELLKSLLVFIIAGLCEIGGGYLVWLWIKEGKPFWYGIIGAAILVCYGIVATLQPTNFARVYAAYGGVFIVMSLLWGWKIDNFRPDKFDIIGAIIVLIGVSKGRRSFVTFCPHWKIRATNNPSPGQEI